MEDFEEVKDVVIETLEKTGVISEMKAKVRAHIYKILQNDSKKYKNLNFNIETPSSLRIHESPENMQILEFIIEFLQFFNFDYTLNILQQEANLEEKKITRDLLISKYKVPREKVKGGKPLLNSYFYEGGSVMPKAVFNNFSEKNPSPKKEPIKVENNKGSKGKTFGIDDEEEKPLKFSFKPPNSSIKSGANSNSLLNNITGSMGGNSNYDFDIDDPISGKMTFDVPKKANHLNPISGNKNVKPNSPLTTLPPANFGSKKSNFLSVDQNSKDLEDSYKYEEDFEIEEDIEEDIEFDISKNENKVTSSEDYNLASQSMGVDKSVDFFTIEDYDYYEVVKPKR